MNGRLRTWAGGIAALVACQAAVAETPCRALILTGRNNHDWKAVAAETAAALESSGRFTVTTVTDPAGLTPAALGAADVLVSVWNSFGAKKAADAEWPDAVKTAVLGFVRDGKGHVVLHAGGSSFGEWADYQAMIGGASWKNGATHHGAPHEFPVRIAAADHPVTRGMAGFTTRDELWIDTRLDAAATVLAEGRTADGASWQPVAAANAFGRGRNFILLLGHDAETLRQPGTRALLLRGTEWAGTGAVTLPACEPAPTAEQVLPRVLAYTFGASREPLRQLDDLAAAATTPAARAALADAIAATLARGGAPDARVALVRALGVTGSENHAATLATLAADPALTLAACGALERIGGATAASALRAALEKAGTAAAPELARALGRMGDAASVPLLVPRAVSPEAAVRAAAWDTLGMLGTAEARAALMAARAKVAPEEREALGRALLVCAAKASPADAASMLDALSGDAVLSSELRGAALALGFRTSEDGAARITKALGSGDAVAAAAALRAIDARGPQGFDVALAGALNTLSPRLQPQALALLGRAGTEAARVAVRGRLADADEAVRLESIRAAGQLDDAAAAKDLIARLDGAERDERRVVAAALTRMSSPEVSAALLATLDAPSAVARAAGEILAAREAPGRSVAPALLKAIREGNEAATRSAAKALGLLGDAAAAAELLDLAVRGTDVQAKAALPALQQILRRPGSDATAAVKPALASAPAGRRAGLVALLAADGTPATLALLTEQLRGDDLESRLAALRVLGSWQGAEPLAALKAAAARATDDREKGLARRAILAMSGGAGGINVARGAKADSPDDVEKDGQSGGDAAGIDGDLKTYWDEKDNQPLYRYRVTLKAPATISALRITGWQQEHFAPKTFDVLADDRVVASVRDLRYEDNVATVVMDPVKTTTVELRITESHGPSPAIRELEILAEPVAEEKKP